mmetsp:Transcript_129425/g.360507  ORF Transcript_129425/g.360507 Transcript_129425/m.360507 type:complete len:94 (-) Transcript_129425:7-288(-)
MICDTLEGFWLPFRCSGCLGTACFQSSGMAQNSSSRGPGPANLEASEVGPAWPGPSCVVDVCVVPPECDHIVPCVPWCGVSYRGRGGDRTSCV